MWRSTHHKCSRCLCYRIRWIHFFAISSFSSRRCQIFLHRLIHPFWSWGWPGDVLRHGLLAFEVLKSAHHRHHGKSHQSPALEAASPIWRCSTQPCSLGSSSLLFTTQATSWQAQEPREGTRRQEKQWWTPHPLRPRILFLFLSSLEFWKADTIGKQFGVEIPNAAAKWCADFWILARPWPSCQPSLCTFCSIGLRAIRGIVVSSASSEVRTSTRTRWS